MVRPGSRRVNCGTTRRPTAIPAQKPEAAVVAAWVLQPPRTSWVDCQVPMLVSMPAYTRPTSRNGSNPGPTRTRWPPCGPDSALGAASTAPARPTRKHGSAHTAAASASSRMSVCPTAPAASGPSIAPIPKTAFSRLTITTLLPANPRANAVLRVSANPPYPMPVTAAQPR